MPPARGNNRTQKQSAYIFDSSNLMAFKPGMTLCVCMPPAHTMPAINFLPAVSNIFLNSVTNVFYSSRSYFLVGVVLLPKLLP